MSRRGAFYDIFEQPCSVCHLICFAVFQSGFIYSWPGLGVPALEIDLEKLAVIPNGEVPL